ncbi:hypothetical protein [Chamaesiphon sp. VAR_48_metabat_135_sub]|nr:hypothetical protein [Chamaesiphon sp. VAR_48_metabat_135_sub]
MITNSLTVGGVSIEGARRLQVKSSESLYHNNTKTAACGHRLSNRGSLQD